MTHSIFGFIIVLGVLIFVHELGHFIVARLCGVGVEKFSLGFGPRLIGRKIGRTDYRISAIPLGGYVKMVGDEPDSEIAPEDIAIAFDYKSVWKRILIVAAGPVSNFLLAVFIFWVLYLVHGIEHLKPVVEQIQTETTLITSNDVEGFQKGDIITAIENEPVKSWTDVVQRVEASKGRTLAFTVKRGNSGYVINVTPQLEKSQNLFGEEIQKYGIGVSPFPAITPTIGEVRKNTPAMRAGLQAGDRIITIDGTAVKSWKEMAKVISACNGRKLELEVQRAEKRIATQITPELWPDTNNVGEKIKRYMIGITAVNVPPQTFTERLNPLRAAVESIARTYEITELTVLSIVKIFQNKISSKTIGGPIMIAEMAGQRAKEGILSFVFFIALLSVNLGLINLFPIPVLDGGHLLFFTIESLKGSPLSMKAREISQQAGVCVLLALMVFIFYNDIMRVFFS
ncbi:RIP metalloprotease RseP [Desulfococcaceae bacterium HSG7]|nr:RIP metalloprotease RseP [Desulfococcaceae bacterium HSG7]